MSLYIMAKKILSTKGLIKLAKTNPQAAELLIRQKELKNSSKDNLIDKMLFDGMEKIKGDAGHTPTNQELLSLILPLIPRPIKGKNGETPTNKELKELILPLIPEPIAGEDGETPTEERLRGIIRPLMEKMVPIIQDLPKINEEDIIRLQVD